MHVLDHRAIGMYRIERRSGRYHLQREDDLGASRDQFVEVNGASAASLPSISRNAPTIARRSPASGNGNPASATTPCSCS
jgi:hypothetical protein